MRLIYKHQHEGIWFSHNGHYAYLQGEKPLFMWDKEELKTLKATVKHHIARVKPSGLSYTRELVMFYDHK